MSKAIAKSKRPTRAPSMARGGKSTSAARKAVSSRPDGKPLAQYDPRPEYVRETLRAMEEHDRRVAADPSEARRFLIKMGLMTKGGKLSKRFGG